MTTIAERLDMLGDLVDGQATVERSPNRAEWLTVRLTGIGSSDLPVILGLRGSPLALWAEKCKGLSEDLESEAAEFGVALEPIVKRKYTERTGRRLLHVPAWTVLRSLANPWMLASLDDVILPSTDRNGHGGAGAFEAKTTSAWLEKDWDGEPPLMYQAQVSWQLAVAGMEWGSFGVIIGGQKFRHVDMEINRPFIVEAQELAYKFWRHVQQGTEPPAGPGDQRILGLLYASPRQGSVVDLGEPAMEWDRQIRDGQALIKTVAAQVSEAQNRLRQAIGDAEAGRLPDGVVWTNKLTMRAGYTVEATEFRQLRRKEGK